jgi:hypothetical protein
MPAFFRLAVAERHPRSGQLAGVFVAAYRLRRKGAVPSFELRALDEVIDWFERNLKAPRPMTDAAICWFKGVANPCTRQVWRLA